MPKISSPILISAPEQAIHFKPGGNPVSFAVEVINQSNQFASFQLELESESTNNSWYRLSPEVSAKKPPGSATTFQVTITNTPVPGFVGRMNLLVLVASPELRKQERRIIRLYIESGTEQVALSVNLPTLNFQVQPDDLLFVPVYLFNPSKVVVDTLLQIKSKAGQPEIKSWFVQGNRQEQRLASGKTETKFLCKIPSSTPAANYEFTVEVYRKTLNATDLEIPISSADGCITVRPDGHIQFICEPREQRLPAAKLSWMPKWGIRQAIYQLILDGTVSNLEQKVRVAVEQDRYQPKCDCRLTAVEAASEPDQISNGKVAAPAAADLALSPDQIGDELPAPHEGHWDTSDYLVLKPEAQVQFALKITKQRPWFGLPRRYLFTVQAEAENQRLDVRDDTQMLQLWLQPLLPIRLQFLSGLGLLTLLWLILVNPFGGHNRSVNSVQFNGAGDRLISASDDQSLRQWRVGSFFNPFQSRQINTLGRTQKSVRVVRYRPVSNDLVAAGLENGDVEIWSAIAPQREPLKTLSRQKDDRVLDLAFSRDARYLFSSHGSGTVEQWQVDRLLSSPSSLPQPAANRTPALGFAAYALAPVGDAGDTLAIGGQFNQLVLWNWQKNTQTALKYPPGSKDDYILSLATAEYQPDLLAVATNQGKLTLLSCNQGSCQITDEWQGSDRPLQAIALSPNGCYLASTGDDGRVMLWGLAADGKRSPEFPTGKVAATLGTQVRSVALTQQQDTLSIATGAADSKVQIIQQPGFNSACGRR